MAVILNKAELANWLGISLPTLSSWMLRYGPEFPVVERGTNGRDYRFEAEAVADFLRAKQEEEAALKARRDEALAQLRLPMEIAPEVGIAPGSTLPIKDQIAALELRRRQREEAERSRLLVLAAPVRDAFRAVLTRISADNRASLGRLAREHSWPDAYLRELERRWAEQQASTVAALEEAFASAGGEESGRLAL